MKSGAEVLRNYCFVNETEKIDDHYKTYISGMIMGLYLNNIITRSEAEAAKAIIKAVYGGMHPELRYFYK